MKVETWTPLLLAMRGRHSSNSIDKVRAIAFPFQLATSIMLHSPYMTLTRRFQ